LIDAMKAGNLEEARAINRKYRKLFRLNFIDSNPVPVKYALSLMGMVEEVYRLPLVPMAESNKAILRAELEQLGLV
jgi:4-hydroxy-tetrahydrodipicolinate synthase